jgi:ATP-binding cassette subfamily B protein
MLYLIFAQQISVGQFFSLLIYSFFIFGPLQELGNVINIYRETEASMANFEEVLAIPVDAKPENPIAVDRLEELAFEHVSFVHRTASAPALVDISFRVGRGDTVAFVGPSGAGKTTLVKLLVGLYAPQEAAFLYNGHPAHASTSIVSASGWGSSRRTRSSSRARFARTSSSCVPMRRTRSASTSCIARRREPASSRRQGLDTVIGEGGVKVSGGEKQRLSIARALLRRPQLLVFDEATSALDSLTEEEITQTVRKVSSDEDGITILIAHRLSTIMHADRIYVLERGRDRRGGRARRAARPAWPVLRDVAPAGRRASRAGGVS